MARTHISLRIGTTGLDRIDRIAEEVGTGRSEVLRLLVAESMKSPKIVESVKLKLREGDPL